MAAFYNAQPRQISGAQEITLIGYSDPSEVLQLGENIYRGGNLKTQVAACIDVTHRRAMVTIRQVTRHWVASMLTILKASYSYRSGERANGANAKIMQGVAERMSNKEIKAVANYILA